MCGVRAGTVTRWPGLTHELVLADRDVEQARVYGEVLDLPGWTCFAAGAPPGATKSASSERALRVGGRPAERDPLVGLRD